MNTLESLRDTIHDSTLFHCKQAHVEGDHVAYHPILLLVCESGTGWGGEGRREEGGRRTCAWLFVLSDCVTGRYSVDRKFEMLWVGPSIPARLVVDRVPVDVCITPIAP